jgi:DNA-binding CsgD family transcriptional regulator
MLPPINYVRSSDGIRIAYAAMGSGPPLLLLITRLYRKLDVPGRAEATAWALRNGLAQ